MFVNFGVCPRKVIDCCQNETPSIQQCGGCVFLFLLIQYHTTCQTLRRAQMTFVIQGCPQGGHQRAENLSPKSDFVHFSYSYIAHGNPLSHCDTDFSDNHFIFQVDTAFRGQGLGGLLIEAAEDVSRRSLDAAWFGALTVQNAGNQSDTLLHFDCSVAVAWGMRWNCWSTSLSVLELNVPQTLPRLFCRSRRLFLVGWFLVFFIWYRVSFLFVVGNVGIPSFGATGERW